MAAHKSMCVVTLAGDQYLMPTEAGMKVMQLMQQALACRYTYSDDYLHKQYVAVALVKSDADRAIEAKIIKHVPALRAMTDEAMAAALADLYHRGAEAGAEKATEVMKELGGWLARLVAAHQRKDVGEIVVILDEFIAERCVIKGGPAPTTSY